MSNATHFGLRKSSKFLRLFQQFQFIKEETEAQKLCAQDLTGGTELSKTLSPASSDSNACDLYTRLPTGDSPETQRGCPSSFREITTKPRPEK